MKRKIITKLKKSAAFVCALTLLLSALYNDMLTSAAGELQNTSVASEESSEASEESGEASEESSEASEESGEASEESGEASEESSEASEESGEASEESSEASEESGEASEESSEASEESSEATEESSESSETTEPSAEQIFPEAIGVSMPSEDVAYYVGESVEITLEAPKKDGEDIEGTFSVKVKNKDGDVSEVALDGNAFDLPVDEAGSYTLTISFEPTDTEAYIGTSKEVTYEVSKIAVEIEWLDEGWEVTYNGSDTFTISVEDGSLAKASVEAGTALDIDIKEATFKLSDANAGDDAKEAALIAEDWYAFFDISADKYEISDVPTASISVKPISLTYTVTVDDKMFDLTNAVEAFKVECNNSSDILEADKDALSLNLTKEDILYKNVGDLEEDVEVAIVFVDSYEPKVVDGDGNVNENYKVTKEDIKLNASNIKANEAVELGYGDTENAFSDFTWTYDDSNSTYWINGSDKLIITPKTDCKIATVWKNTETEFTDSKVSVTSNEDKEVVFYAKDAEGHVYKVTLKDVGTDRTAPTVEHKIEKSILLQNTAVVYEITVTDQESGVKSLAYQVTTNAEDGPDADGWNVSELSTSITVTVPAYGYLYIKAEDNVGNEFISNAIRPLVLETEKPVLKVTVDGKQVEAGDTVNEFLTAHTFEVQATDFGEGGSETEFAGVAKIEWKLVSAGSTDALCAGSYEANGEPTALEDLVNFKTLSGEAKTISAGDNDEKLDSEQPYTLVLWATDFAGNKSEDFKVDLKFDNTAPVGSMEVAEGTTRETKVNSAGTTVITDYYNKAFEVNVTISEQLSFKEGEFTFTVLKNGETYKQITSTPTASEFDYDSTTGLATVSCKISPETDGEGVYTFRLEGIDGAGNELVYEGYEYEVILDTTKPAIAEVAYTITGTSDKAEFLSYTEKDADAAKYYVNKEITVGFKVEETYLPETSAVELISNEDLKEIEWSIIDGVAEGSVPVTQYGEFGDKQTVSLTVVDKAGNVAKMTAEKPEHVAFDDNTGTLEDTFIIDTVAPELSAVAYLDSDGNPLEILTADDEKDYINKDVTIVFTVTEHNPTESSIGSITGEVADADYDKELVVEWTPEGDINTGSFTVGQRGKFGDEQISKLYIVDRAGNKVELADGMTLRSEQHKKLEDGTFVDAFTVDTVAPSITAIAYTDADENDIVFNRAEDGRDYVNKDVTITFTVDEHNIPDKTIGRTTEDGTEVDSSNKDDKEQVVTWTKAEDINTGSFTVEQRGEYGDTQTSKLTIVDRAGNKAEISGELRCEDNTTFVEGEFIDVFTVDKVEPKITDISYETNGADFKSYEEGNVTRDYIKEDVEITFKVTEHNITNKSALTITEIVEPQKTDYVEWTSEENGDDYTGSYIVGQRGDGDEQTSTLTIVDRAGNEAVISGATLRERANFAKGEFTDVFTVDKEAPEVTLSYENMERSAAVDETTDSGEEIVVDYFGMANVEEALQKLVLKVSVNEHNFQAGNITIDKEWTGKDVTFTIDEAWTKNDDVNTRLYTMQGDSLYIYKIAGTDKAGNQIVLKQEVSDDISSIQTATGEDVLITLRAAIDSQIPAVGDTLKPVVKITSPENPTGTDICAEHHPLYNSGVTYRAKIYDPLNNDYASGIDKIVITATGVSGVTSTATIDKTGAITYTSDGMLVKLENKDTEAVLATLAKGEANAYDYSITLDGEVFNSNDIKVVVEVTDVSTNALTNVETSLISIDTTPPEVSVSYDNNDVRNDMYFNANRTATITVTERNWSSDCISIDVTNGSVSSWKKETGSDANGDNTRWIGYVNFTSEGSCSLGVSTVDRASNRQVKATQFSGAAPHSFIIDKTAPVLSYSFDNNAAQNEKYYMASRILTVTVTDAYFAGQNDIVVLSNGQASGMTFNGLVATHAFVSDGVYSFQGTVTDLAGNVSAPITGSEFVIDLTVPVVDFEGIEDQKAYGPDDTFEPDVNFTDTNFYEGGVTFELIREDWDGQDAPITGNYAALMYVLGQSSNAPAGRDDLYRLTDTSEEVDGLYTLTVYVYDQAGNRNNGEEGDTIQFSINRYGSVYILDEATRAELNGYYIAQVPNIVIHEYNLSNAAESWIDIITSAGERVRLVKGTDYTVSSEGAAEGCDWRMRTYTILAQNFTTDGEYTIEIYVKDDVNNVSTNNDPKSENRGVSVNFVKDTEDPNVTLGGPENEGIYDGSEMTLTIAYGDNIRMSRLIVTITNDKGEVIDVRTYAVPILNEKGEKVLPEGADEELDIYSGEISYLLKENTSVQTITVTAIDAAGNDTSVENEEGTDHAIPAISFTLSTSKFVLWYNNKPAFYGTIGGALGTVAAAMIVLLIAKRRKKNKEQAES